MVEDLAELPAGFDGVAVTTAGRVWSARTQELRQAPAVGEERVLAERNRREQLCAPARRPPKPSSTRVPRWSGQPPHSAAADSVREERSPRTGPRSARSTRRRRSERRIAALIERRRARPMTGPDAERGARS